MNRIYANASNLINLYCEIEIKNDEGEPNITKIYPTNYSDDEVLKIIGNFAFPFRSKLESKNASPSSFSFVLTNEQYRFGFCRREIPSGSGCSKAVVLLSFWPWHDVFLKFINVLTDLRKKVSERQFDNFLNLIYKKPVPDEHCLMSFTFADHNGIVIQEFSFRRPFSRQLPSIPENHNLNLFFNYIQPKSMIEIFAALMAERRIIFVSNNLDKLSSCLQASCSLLFPMFWQHIYIPLLPIKLRDYLSAPMPYCVGCPEAVFETVRREEIGDVVIINCDTNCVENPFNDVSEMPQDIVNYLKKHLNNSSTDLRGDRIPRIFLSTLVQIIGGYRDAIKYSDSKMRFDNDTFIESQPSQYKAFVQKIVELQVFQQFIEERLRLIQSNSEVTDEFEIEVELHAARMGKKMMKYKEFIRNIKGRANPAVKNAVKSVKAGVKELKQKIKENTNKSDKHNYHHNSMSIAKKEKSAALDHQYRMSFQQFYPNGANGLNDISPSTSSSQSSSSEMNILQELEAQGIFNSSSGLDSTTSTIEKSRDEGNLIDLSDSTGDMTQFDPLENDELRKSCTVQRTSLKESELLSDVINELNKSTTVIASSRNNWTKFD